VRLLPRQEEFFDLFVEVASRSHEAAEYLLELFTGDQDRFTYCVEAIKRLEHEADHITHEVVNRLDRTFITPIDREDIHLLASDLDDVIDCIDDVARHAQIFRIGRAPDGVRQMCQLIEQITDKVKEAVALLRKNKEVMPRCVEAKRIEEEGDAVYHEMLGRLFDTETDPVILIKWKEIFHRLEVTIDQAEDVANDIESISLKHS
jgi:predicted phosphate transport protein (TIGR00153 family)